MLNHRAVFNFEERRRQQLRDLERQVKGIKADSDPLSMVSSIAEKVDNTDSRLSDAREPLAHSDSHASDGSDPITPSQIGAQSVELARSAWHSSTAALDVVSRTNAMGSVGISSGVIYWQFFTPQYNFTASSISMATQSTAAAGLTLARMGLYSFGGTTLTLQAATANDTSLFGATTTVYTRNFDSAGGLPTNFNLVAGQRYATALLIVGTTAPGMVGFSQGFHITSLAPRVTASLSSQTDLVASRTSFGTTTVILWSRLQ